MDFNKRDTAWGQIKRGDIAVATFRDTTIVILYFQNLYFGEAKNKVCYSTFWPSLNEVDESEFESWESFGKIVTKLSVFGNLGSDLRNWENFVCQFKNEQLISKAECLIARHIAYTATR